MTFGEKLSTLRKEHNYTQEQLAELLGVSRQSVSKWESDVAYPETDKLIKIGKLFDCSMDYLLKEEVTERHTDDTFSDLLRKGLQYRERKSTKTVFGMPLYHIGKNAHGFFAVGIKARGVFSLGLFSRGIVSMGLFSIGILSMGILSLGVIALGSFALGLLAMGSIALGVFAAGAISIGIISLGALSVGSFSIGANAIGQYFALGDHASATVAIGKTVADGDVYSHVGDLSTADLARIAETLDSTVPQWLSFARALIRFFIA